MKQVHAYSTDCTACLLDVTKIFKKRLLAQLCETPYRYSQISNKFLIVLLHYLSMSR